MARLIDADKLIKVIKDDVDFNKEYCLDNFFTKGYRAGMRNLYNIIANQPTVDTVKHGHWTYDTDTEDTSLLICSECNRWVYDTGYEYCPHCGTKMDGKAE